MGLDVRKLVALDIAFLGARVIVAEYAAGIVICACLGVLSLNQWLRAGSHGINWQVVLGVALLWIALNYVPLFIHAADLARRGTAREEVGLELGNMKTARSYSWRQLWILVPLAVVVLDVAQRSARAR